MRPPQLVPLPGGAFSVPLKCARCCRTLSWRVEAHELNGPPYAPHPANR